MLKLRGRSPPHSDHLDAFHILNHDFETVLNGSEVNNCVVEAPGAAKVSMVVASWVGEVIRRPTGAQILNLSVSRWSHVGPRFVQFQYL